MSGLGVRHAEGEEAVNYTLWEAVQQSALALWPSGIISLHPRIAIGAGSSPRELPTVQPDNLQCRKASRSLCVAPGDERSIEEMVDRLPVGEGTP